MIRVKGFPKIEDPRWILFAFFGVLIGYALSTPGFARTWSHALASFGVCALLDLLLCRIRTGQWLFPMSGVVSAFGVFVLIDSPLLWPTALAAVLAMFSKHFIRVRGNHLFNPNNFGVAMVIWGFPDLAVTGAHRWAGKVGLSLLLFAIGWLLVWRAKRWLVSLSYVLAFFAFNFLRTLLFHKPWWAYSLALLGPAMQLFVFYMISDPRTSPEDHRRQIIFGVTIAAVDNLFRHLEMRDAPLFAVFLVCLVYNLYRAYRPDQIAFRVWKTREIQWGIAK